MYYSTMEVAGKHRLHELLIEHEPKMRLLKTHAHTLVPCHYVT